MSLPLGFQPLSGRLSAAALSLLLAGGLLLAPTRAPAAQAEQESGVSVVGEGLVTARPDIARITVGVERFEPSLAPALEHAAAAMDAVIARLVQLGVSRDDIQTVRFSVSPVYDTRGDAPSLRGYRVSNALEATLRDIDRVGTVIDDVVAAGATRVEGVSFETSRLAELKAQAREQAMVNARTKAEQLAQLAGARLGSVIRIQESDAGGPAPVRTMAAPEAGAASTPIEAGQLQIRTVVSVTWQLE